MAQMTVQQWSQSVANLLATTEPIAKGTLGPKAMTFDVVFRAFNATRIKLQEAGGVLTQFSKAIEGHKAQLAVAQVLIDKQHGIIQGMGGNPDGPAAVAALSRRVQPSGQS